MDSEKIFIVGDIHGCLDMLKRLMEKIDWSPDKDRLIFLGDYIDRGMHSKGVVDYILSLIRYSSQVECLKGNHEIMFLSYLSGFNRNTFLINGGLATIKSYQAENPQKKGELISPEHESFFESLESYIELEDYYLVHAGFRPGIEIEKQSDMDIFWIREDFIYSDYDFGKKVIFGHTPFSEPLVRENKIGLDTGAVFGNKLTCLQLPEFMFYSVEA